MYFVPGTSYRDRHPDLYDAALRSGRRIVLARRSGTLDQASPWVRVRTTRYDVLLLQFFDQRPRLRFVDGRVVQHQRQPQLLRQLLRQRQRQLLLQQQTQEAAHEAPDEALIYKKCRKNKNNQ